MVFITKVFRREELTNTDSGYGILGKLLISCSAVSSALYHVFIGPIDQLMVQDR